MTPAATPVVAETRQRLAELLQRFQRVKVHAQPQGLVLRLTDLLPLEQIVFRRELLATITALQSATNDDPPVHDADNAWRISIIAADDPIIVPLAN